MPPLIHDEISGSGKPSGPGNIRQEHNGKQYYSDNDDAHPGAPGLHKPSGFRPFSALLSLLEFLNRLHYFPGLGQQFV